MRSTATASIGTRIIKQDAAGSMHFEFERGPVFTQLLLADEINRATPKTQSALLEAMQERRVTVAGTTYPLPEPFAVLATQNPLEQEGTYPLPEAQLDRFLVKLLVRFPTIEMFDGDAELRIVLGRSRFQFFDRPAQLFLGLTEVEEYPLGVHDTPSRITLGR